MQKMIRRKVYYNPDDSKLYGQNVGDYPIHHFYSQNFTSRDTEAPLMVNTCGFDLMCRGVYRVRKNCNVCSVEIVREGEMEYKYGDTAYHCMPGDIFILHQESDNRMECVSDFAKTSCAGFCGNMLVSIFRQLHLSNVPFIRPSDPEPFFRLFDQIEELGREQDPQNFPLLFAAGYELLLRLAKIEQLKKRDYPPLLENILCYLEAEFSEKISMEKLSLAFRVSQGTIFSLFKRYLGCPPMEYLIRIRMNHAVRMLKECDDPIKKVASDCGYNDQLYFSQQFHRLYGISPSACRNSPQTPEPKL